MSDHPPRYAAMTEEQLLAAYLADRNVPCPRCTYNLRGVTSGSCPECGEQIVITVGQADHSTMPWIIAMSLYGLAAFLSGVYAFVGLWYAALEGGQAAEDVLILAAMITAFALSVVGFLLVTQRRERIWRSSVLMQLLVVLSVLLVPLAAFIVMAAGLALVL